MKWIVPVENMREADRYCIEKLQVPGIILMEAAARSVVEKITMQCRKEDKILVICGTGNNGGDGFAIARMLKIKGYAVRVFLAGSPWMLSGDAKINFDMLSSYQISVLTQDQALALEGIINQSDWVVDAMFGTGLDREVTGLYDQIIKYVNKVHDRGNLKVMAVDIPSGVAGNTGQILGCAIEADET
ncbi:MAG: NAD(P)H-hydrate epimerase, partial [Firmicutes bacterium]|nr:NAD(P)H-hydrate epimerase [Bacillota bacterium]